MSETPPPTNQISLDDDKPISSQIDLDLENSAEKKHQQPSDDLFFSTISDPESSSKKNIDDMDEIFKANSSPSPSTTNLNKEIKLTDDEEDDPFSTDNQSKKSISSNNKSEQPPLATNNINIQPIAAKLDDSDKSSVNKSSSISNSMFSQTLADEEEESRDKFIEISVSDPAKVGDGMGSYMVYKITTKTNYPIFRSSELSANRRFSDFLNLFEKLKEKHLQAGRILPPAPEKDMLGMAKVKMSKEDTTPVDFIEKRRASLQRFLLRLASHKTFRYDPDFRDFLEIAEDLPKATNTSALSGAGMLKMFKNVTDSMSKISIKMEETDQWFEDKSRQVDNLFIQYKKLHAMVELLYGWRKDLASSTKDFSKSAAILANSEEQLTLSRSLSQLGEIYEKIDQIYLDQSNADYFVLAELIKDYVSLFDNIKEAFYQRIKWYSLWQRAEEALKAKKDSKAKLEASNKLDKVPAVAAEIRDMEAKVEKLKEDFERISKTIKEELRRFDFNRAREFRAEFIKYLKTLLKNQELLVKNWEQYLIQVKSI